LASEIKQEVANIVVVFVIGLIAALAGFYAGYNARGVDNIGAKVNFVLPELTVEPETKLQRVSL
jgi:hypothetical protein